MEEHQHTVPGRAVVPLTQVSASNYLYSCCKKLATLLFLVLSPGMRSLYIIIGLVSLLAGSFVVNLRRFLIFQPPYFRYNETLTFQLQPSSKYTQIDGGHLYSVSPSICVYSDEGYSIAVKTSMYIAIYGC